jgi:hypothetical protein
MARKEMTRPHLWGNSDVAVSRYFALYVAQAGWLVLGAYLFANSYWPSTCKPHGFLEVYECSARLADNRGWVESSLMTWLWSTPILVMLEVMRHYERLRSKPKPER